MRDAAPLVGIDCSTQSTKVVVCEAATGRVLAEGRAPHPGTTEVHPDAWWQAYTKAAEGLVDDAAAIGVSGQQHGLVPLDDDGAVVRPALLWNDTRSAQATADLVRELGGTDVWAQRVGSVPVPSFTVTKLRWLAEHEPGAADRVARILLPHDWMTWRLLGSPRRWTTDRGDASGTGYYSAATGEYRRDLLALAFGRAPELPEVLDAGAAAGHTPRGAVVSAGTGDNMAAALGLGAGPGDVVVSLGTSGTVFAVHAEATADSSGVVAGFADATGRFLPLVCTLNAARVLSATANLLGTDLAGLDALALSAPPGADGLVLLPYLDGERTPNLPDASGTLLGLRRGSMTAENLARAAVEGMLCGLADGLDALRAQGIPVRRVLLVGGAARSAAVRTAAPLILGAPVTVPPPAEYAAIGAARQAAWALAGTPEPPDWPLAPGTTENDGVDEDIQRRVRSRYAEMRDLVHGR